MQYELYAHRGAPKDHPENTMESFRQAVEDGAAGFECDIVFTKDKEPIVLHPAVYNSPRLPKFMGTAQTLATLTWKDIQQLRVHGEYHVPHLDEVLEFVTDNKLKCFIEPKQKSKELVEDILTRLQQGRLLKRCSFITFGFRSYLLEWAESMDPNVRSNVILINPTGDWVARAKHLHAHEVTLGWSGTFNHLHFYHRFFHLAEKIKQVEADGIAVMAGNADNEFYAEWMKDLGVTKIFTNEVKRVATYLQKT